jgi:hypothetical protein
MKNAENTSTAATQPATMIHTCYPLLPDGPGLGDSRQWRALPQA